MKISLCQFILIVSMLSVFSSCEEDIDIDELQDAVTDSFSPVFDVPLNPRTLRRITEIKSTDTITGGVNTSFIYAADGESSGWGQIKFIWNAGECDNSLAYFRYDGQITKEAYVGQTGLEPDRMSEEDLELFKLEADEWIFEMNEYGFLDKVYSTNTPGTYRRFTYNPDRDFFDSIIDYTENRIDRVLKYQYAADNWTLAGILDLNHSGDTTAIYTFEFESVDFENRNGNPIYTNWLIGIPNAQCTYLFLNGPLFAWHFPDPVKKLFKGNMLVYEASYEYESLPAYPEVVNYSRTDDDGITHSYSEDVKQNSIASGSAGFAFSGGSFKENQVQQR